MTHCTLYIKQGKLQKKKQLKMLHWTLKYPQFLHTETPLTLDTETPLTLDTEILMMLD